MKSYEAKEKVVQKGLMKRVIFQGMLHNEKVYKGKWYCKGEERNAELTGEWCLIAKTVSLNVGSLNQLQDFSLEMLNK